MEGQTNMKEIINMKMQIIKILIIKVEKKIKIIIFLKKE